MTALDKLAIAALAGEAMTTRSLLQDFRRLTPRLADVPAPESQDGNVRSLAAALIKLLAQRNGEPPPEWSAQIGAVIEPIHLLLSARTMKRLRQLCEQTSPEPLRKRGFFAPANYLMSA